jgi:hypothetical protein
MMMMTTLFTKLQASLSLQALGCNTSPTAPHCHLVPQNDDNIPQRLLQKETTALAEQVRTFAAAAAAAAASF